MLVGNKRSSVRVQVLGMLYVAGVLILQGAEPSRLYIVAGTPTAEAKVPIYLYSLDAGKAGQVKTEFKIGDGLTCVLPDYQLRTVAVLSPELAPDTITFINMDEPGIRIVRMVSYDANKFVPYEKYLLRNPREGLGVALALGEPSAPGGPLWPSALTFVPLKGGAVIQLPLEDTRYVRWAGFPGGPLDNLHLQIELRGDPLSVPQGPAVKVSIGIARPPYLKTYTGNLTLVANDDDRTILESADEPGVIDVLDKAKNEWRRIPTPFGGVLRAFGPWVAGLEVRSANLNSAPSKKALIVVTGKEERAVSPGSKKRMSEKIRASSDASDDDSASVEDYFAMKNLQGTVYPGELFVLNLNTGAQIRISTGSGDSEVLLVANGVIYYRVDDALFRADIVGSSLSNTVKLAEGPEIVQAHWAFLN